METVKDITNITSPDERNLYFVTIDSNGELIRPSLERLHSLVTEIKLHKNVPEDIRCHFSQAQNLAIYSWFHYPFNVTSQFMAFISVEFALKRKTGKNSSFKSLIGEAVTNGWINDSGFSIAAIREGAIEKSYVETLVDVMPKLRNKLAHGSNMIHNNSLSSLQICAEFINQLFEDDPQ